jgi:hypothetical protein
MEKKAGRFIASTATSAAQRVTSWWAAKKPFQGNDGSNHTLLFIGEGPSAKIAFQSSTTELEAFLDTLTGADKKETDLIKAIRADVTKINTLKGTPGNDAAIDAAMGRISDRLGQLIGSKRWGSEDQPLPFDYPKPAAANYRTLYFGPRTDKWVPQDELKAAFSEGLSGGTPGPKRQKVIDRILVRETKDWAVNAYKIEKYEPCVQKDLPDGGATIGVTGEYQIRTGMKFKVIPGSTAGGSKINNQLKKYGYDLDREDTQGDHLLEMQLGGPNILENLWPLNRAMNGAGGNDTKNAVLKKPDGNDVKMSEVKEAAEKRPVWLFLAGTK